MQSSRETNDLEMFKRAYEGLMFALLKYYHIFSVWSHVIILKLELVIGRHFVNLWKYYGQNNDVTAIALREVPNISPTKRGAYISSADVNKS